MRKRVGGPQPRVRPATVPSMHSHLAVVDPRVLSRDECIAITERITRSMTGDGGIEVEIRCWGNGELRWARNRISLASERRDVFISIVRLINGGRGEAVTNQLDDVSLSSAVKAAERLAHRNPDPAPSEMPLPTPDLSTPTPKLWSDTTAGLAPEARGSIALQCSDNAEAKAMMSAGYVETRAASNAVYKWSDASDGGSYNPEASTAAATAAVRAQLGYTRLTQSQCSMTVRHPKGVGSGWAGLSSYDWTTLDGAQLAQRALDKCMASLNPKRIEPGRYTVVLERQAVCDLASLLMVQSAGDQDPFNRPREAEEGRGPFPLGHDQALSLWRTKSGMKVIDERLTISHDPMDPLLGTIPEPGLEPVTWIDRGVITSLTYERTYALRSLNQNTGAPFRPSFRMSGGDTSIEEMISTTKRGLLVTRFSNLRVLDSGSLLATGVTRDGLWLIESGKITYSVKNMRITESPLFVFNQVVQLGEPAPVFRPIPGSFDVRIGPAIVPLMKANDFSFTSTIDAV